MSTMTKATAYAVLSRAVAAQRNGSAPEQVARLDAALAVAGEVLLAAEREPCMCETLAMWDAKQASVPLLPVKPDGN